MKKTPAAGTRAIRWAIYKLTAKAVQLGTIEAADDAAAIEKDAAEFKLQEPRVRAIERSLRVLIRRPFEKARTHASLVEA
jgi:hypothetical protein